MQASLRDKLTGSVPLLRFADESKHLKYSTKTQHDTQESHDPVTKCSCWAAEGLWEWPHMGPWKLFFLSTHHLDTTDHEGHPKATYFFWYKEHSSGLAAEWEDSKHTLRSEVVPILIPWLCWPRPSNVLGPEKHFSALTMQENQSLHTGIM